MTEKSKRNMTWGDLIKSLIAGENWYLGWFIVLLILFVIFDIIAFTPHH